MGAISVVILTRGTRDEIGRSISSVANQQCEVPVRLTVVADRPEPGLIDRIGRRTDRAALDLQSIKVSSRLSSHPTEHVAHLRSKALEVIDTPFVAFLDDDNWWAPTHLASLYGLLETRRDGKNLAAVHSWRHLQDSTGAPYVPEGFPWRPDGEQSRTMYETCRKLGILDGKSAIVRDRVSATYHGREYGMVDMGEWLFRTCLFDRIDFPTVFTTADRESQTGEDDKLLSRIRERSVNTASSKQTTLHYQMGGFSNAAYTGEGGREDP